MSAEKGTFFQHSASLKPEHSFFRLNVKRYVFFGIFFLIFCFSGFIRVITITWGRFEYRMGLGTLLVLPIVFLYGIKVDRVFVSYLTLGCIVFMSGLYNVSPLSDILLFIRTLVFSYLMYLLVDLCIYSGNITQVIRWCVRIAIVQLPIVLFQQSLYYQFPSSVRSRISLQDIGFGTFNIHKDSSMAFFLTLLVIFLLFDKKRNYIIRHRWLIIFWLTVTVLIANAAIVRYILAFVWMVYLLTHLKPRTVVFSFTVLFFIIVGLKATGWLDIIWADSVRAFHHNIDTSQTENFLTGGYSRGAAIAYYLNSKILWLGDGPSRYYDVISGVRLRGNTGHIFTFYSEVGLPGWLLSVLIFVFIMFPGRSLRFRVSGVGLLSFFSLQALSLTTSIMNDIDVVLICCIIAKTYLIPFAKAPCIQVPPKSCSTLR